MIIVRVSLVRVLPFLFVVTIYYRLCLIFYAYVSWSQWLALACIWEIRYTFLWWFCLEYWKCLALFNRKIYSTVNYSFIFILYFKLNQRLSRIIYGHSMLVYVFLTHVLWFYCKLKELQKTCSMHQEEWSKRDFGGDYQPATGEAEQITQTRHGA